MISQAAWFEKLKRFLPEWFWEDEANNVAHAQAAAKVLEQLSTDLEEHIAETFLITATGLNLDAQGDERSVPRLQLETDGPYSVRVRNITNQSNCPAIEALVNALLIRGTCTIIDDYESALFFNRGAFFNRSDILIEEIYNVFTIVVERQQHDPYSFFNRLAFADRENYMGAAFSSQFVYDLIVAAVDKNKAGGTLYRIVELSEEA